MILIGGGARSGKSRYALVRARACGTRLTFVATAQPNDEEMASRIEQHRAERGPDFITVEEPLDLARAIHSTPCDAMVVDCLTLWLSNLVLAGAAIAPALSAAIDASREHPGEVIFVTNEVGCGIVPENALAREFRDHAGRMNQRVAECASEVYWMVFGQPLRVK